MASMKVIMYTGGLGDYIMLSCIAHELKKRDKDELVYIICYSPEIFIHNNDVDLATFLESRATYHISKCNAKIYHPHYLINHDRHRDTRLPLQEHVLGFLCRNLGITGEVTLRPYIYLDKVEKDVGRYLKRKIGDYVVMQSTSSNARSPSPLKEWYPDRFNKVAKDIKLPIIQIGTKKDPIIDGALDCRGKTSIRESASILKASRLFVGLESGLMHMARAVNCPGVIIYGGRLLPSQIGYICNINITNHPPCSPCWRNYICDHDMLCMQNIYSSKVTNAIEEMLDRSRYPQISETCNIVPLGNQ